MIYIRGGVGGGGRRDKFGKGSVLNCGGIMGSQKTDLVIIQVNLNAQSYINNLNNIYNVQ